MARRILEGRESAPASESHNLFFALWPCDEVRTRIDAAARQLRRDLAPAGRWLAPRRYHMTLHFLGNHTALPEELVALARAAGDDVRVAPFELALDVAGSFRNRKIPWWLGCSDPPSGLLDLWAAIALGFRAGGSRALNGSQRVPHVTILRDATTPLSPMPIAAIAWPVDEFVLVDSLLGPKAEYTILRRWPLSRA
jgi:2'-5' RNA ligase